MKPFQQQPQRKKGKPVKLDGVRPKRLMGGKPKGKRDSEGRYGLSGGGLVASAMEVQKPN